MTDQGRTRRRVLIALGALAVAATAAAACGSPTAKSSAGTPTAAAQAGHGGANDGAAGDPAGENGFERGTPPADALTAVAQGTPLAGHGGTPSAAEQTSVAQGTPLSGFRDRTPSADEQTAIAQGTPVGPRGGFGGGRTLSVAAQVLGIDLTQLQTALAQPSASLQGIAQQRGIDRATLKQKITDGVRAQLAAEVAAGTMTQAQADQASTEFDSTIDSTLDRVGGFRRPPAGQ